METTIKKCDRCKAVTDTLIDLTLVNTNVNEADTEEKESVNMFTMAMIGPSRKQHPTLKKEVCVTCATEFCRWVEHSENLLIPRKR